jgi:lipid-binding SYLF domain-containing protein
MKRTLIPLLLFALLAAVTSPAADKAKDEETIKNATTVLQDVLSSNSIPQDVLSQADCIVILPNVKKFAVGVGGSGGRGTLSCRAGDKFDGKWSAPAVYSIGGANVGFQLGGSSTDFVLLVMDEKGVDAVLRGKTKLGSDATAAAGPSGATKSSASVGGADVLSYSHAKGLFAGVSLDGATLHEDGDANKRIYGKAISAKDIVRNNAVATPDSAQSLISELDSKIPNHTTGGMQPASEKK